MRAWTTGRNSCAAKEWVGDDVTVNCGGSWIPPHGRRGISNSTVGIHGSQAPPFEEGWEEGGEEVRQKGVEEGRQEEGGPEEAPLAPPQVEEG